MILSNLIPIAPETYVQIAEIDGDQIAFLIERIDPDTKAMLETENNWSSGIIHTPDGCDFGSLSPDDWFAQVQKYGLDDLYTATSAETAVGERL